MDDKLASQMIYAAIKKIKLEKEVLVAIPKEASSDRGGSMEWIWEIPESI